MAPKVVMYKGEQNIKLDKGEWIAIRAHPCDTGFNTLAQILGNGADTAWMAPRSSEKVTAHTKWNKLQSAMAGGRGRYQKDSEK